MALDHPVGVSWLDYPTLPTYKLPDRAPRQDGPGINMKMYPWTPGPCHLPANFQTPMRTSRRCRCLCHFTPRRRRIGVRTGLSRTLHFLFCSIVFRRGYFFGVQVYHGISLLDCSYCSAIMRGEQLQEELDAGIPAERIILAGFSQGGAVDPRSGKRGRVRRSG